MSHILLQNISIAGAVITILSHKDNFSFIINIFLFAKSKKYVTFC